VPAADLAAALAAAAGRCPEDMWGALEEGGVGAALDLQQFARLMRGAAAPGRASSSGSSDSGASSSDSERGGPRESMSGSVLSITSQGGACACACACAYGATDLQAADAAGKCGACSRGSCSSSQERLHVSRASTCPPVF
jgi:hypothetical protein